MQIADMHCDTLSCIYNANKDEIKENLRNNDRCVDIDKMREADYLLQFFACFVDAAKSQDVYSDVNGMIELFHKEMHMNTDVIAPVFCFNDIIENKKNNKMSALLTIEEGAAIKGSFDILAEMYQKGVRAITLTWNYENEIGYPNHVYNQNNIYGMPERKKGLKKFGFELIEEMERKHMIIDVSHLGDAGFYDVINHTKGPVAATHSNARALSGHVRNLTDDMIRLIAEKGGIIGLNFCPDFLGSYLLPRCDGESRINDMIRHVKHIINIGGEDVIGLGSDFDGIEGNLEIENCARMSLLENALCNAGISERVTEKILNKNLIEFMKNVL